MKFKKPYFPATFIQSRGRLCAVLSVILAFGSGCTAPRQSAPALRVGMAPDYPPLAFERDGQADGAEADFARVLGAQLGRPVTFISFKWEQLIPALQNGSIDIIMSGMSITPTRQLSVAFSEPYLTNQLRAIFTRANAARFKAPRDITNASVRIGVMPGTTADTFVQANCLKAARVALNTRPDAAFYLLQNPQIDVYIDDTFALAPILSAHEGSLTFMKPPLVENSLAWAVRPDDSELLRQVNAVLARCNSDGTVDRILTRWIPYLKEYESLPQDIPSGGRAP
jgi:ABC-type amino acid transport substrate-binding protein